MGWASLRHLGGLPNNLTQNPAFFAGAGSRLAACGCRDATRISGIRAFVDSCGNSVLAEALHSALDATIPRSEVNSCSKPMVMSVSPLRA